MKKEKQTKNVHTKWTLHTYQLFCFVLFIKFIKELFGLIELFCPSPYWCAFSGQILNHTVCEVGKHFWRPSGPNLLLKQKHPGQGAQAHIQVDFEDIRGGDYTTSLDSVCQCSITCIVKKCFLMFRRILLCFSLCPMPLVLSLGTSENSVAPSSLHCPFRYL